MKKYSENGEKRKEARLAPSPAKAEPVPART